MLSKAVCSSGLSWRCPVIIASKHNDPTCICTVLLTAALFVTADPWKQLNCVSGDKMTIIVGWTKKLLYFQSVEYYIAMKISELLLHKTTWGEKTFRCKKKCILSAFLQAQKQESLEIKVWNQLLEGCIKDISRVLWLFYFLTWVVVTWVYLLCYSVLSHIV